MLIVALILAVCGLCAVPAQAQSPILSTTIDFQDSVWHAGRVWTEADTEAQMARLAATGIKRVYLRLGNGVADYPSRVTKMYTDDGREPGGRLLAETVRAYDCLETHVRLGHKYGLQMYFYEELFDDEITTVHYEPGTKEAALYGEYPMKSPFTIAHPEYQIEHRRAQELKARAPRPRHIATIKLVGTDARPTRLDREHLVLYVSDDNRIYHEVTTPWTLTDAVEDGVRVLTFAGLNITARFVRIHCTFADGNFTLWNTSDKFVRVFGTADTPLTGASICYADDDTPPGTAPFLGTPFDLALDYRSRSVGICFDYISPYYGGHLEYCYPQARAFRMAIVREIVQNYAVEGFMFSLRSHSTVAGSRDDYGFGQPVVDEYRRRYGVDIRTHDPDRAKWAQIRGEGVTELLREASAFLRSRGLKLEMMVPPGNTENGGQYQCRYDWIDMDWATWLREGLVDGLVLNAETMPGEWTGPLTEEVRRLREATRQPRRQVVVHANINNMTNEAFERIIPQLYRDPNVDNVELYEEVSLWPHRAEAAARTPFLMRMQRIE